MAAVPGAVEALTRLLQHGGAKVLEKTFEEWLRYRDECLRRMASEPYPAGTRTQPGPGLSLLQHPLLCRGTDKDLHISDGIPRDVLGG